MMCFLGPRRSPDRERRAHWPRVPRQPAFARRRRSRVLANFKPLALFHKEEARQNRASLLESPLGAQRGKALLRLSNKAAINAIGSDTRFDRLREPTVAGTG